MFLDFKQKFKRESEILKGPNILGNLPPPPGNEIPMNINLVQKGGGGNFLGGGECTVTPKNHYPVLPYLELTKSNS